MENTFFLNQPNNQTPDNLTTQILAQEKAQEFHLSLENYAPTPLVELPALASKYQLRNIYLKDESFRFGLNAFKGLGASFALHKVLQKQPQTTTFCTATDGNHGRAVAWSSRLNGKKSVVFVPQNTTAERIKNIEKEGAKVILTDGNYDETCRIAEHKSKENDWILIQDTSWENYELIPAYIMAGYLTQFREMEPLLFPLPLPGIDLVLLQAGVGSWAAAGIWYFLNRYKENRPKLVIVEPNESDGILASLKAGERVIPQGKFDTIMAGLNCGIPSLNTWEIIKNGVDVAIKIEDSYAKKAMNELYYPTGNDKQIISGESGVGGLAGLLTLMTEAGLETVRNFLKIDGSSKILVISTEGATDKKLFNEIVLKNYSYPDQRDCD